MTTAAFVRTRIKRFDWQQDLNCATTMLKVLAAKFDLGLAPQVIAAATGMHGAGEFEINFSSLLCRVLRPGGFHPDNPPHLCEEVTCRALEFTLGFVEALVRDRP